MIRMVMFVLLLLSGDIESNPGPNEHQPMDTRTKKVHKIERMDTNEKMGFGSSTLDRLWIEVCCRWDDVTPDNFKLTEADGTEVVDEFYYQQLASKIPLQLRSKTKGTKSRSKSNARVNARPLTDDVIHEIATNRITHDIVKLGLAMGLTLPSISKYKADNDKEPRAESRGTVNMIMDWRQRCGDADKVGAFCNVLRQAELNELADDLSNDILTGPDRVEVVSPSITGFNSNTKIELTVVSTTKCVIACNNLAEMQAEDLSRLTELLLKKTDHSLPIAEVEAPTTRITGPSADKIYKIRTADDPKSISVSGSVTKEEQSRASSALNSTDISSISQTEVGCSINVTLDKVTDTTYPIALFSLSSPNHPNNLWDWLQRQLPGKTIMLIKDIPDLARHCHLFEAILVDLGAFEAGSDGYKGALNMYWTCTKWILVPQNVAVLMVAPANTRSAHKHADIIGIISKISKTTEVHVFFYGSESCRSLFDDNTKNRLVFWLLDCYKRHVHAAALRTRGPSILQLIRGYINL